MSKTKIEKISVPGWLKDGNIVFIEHYGEEGYPKSIGKVKIDGSKVEWLGLVSIEDSSTTTISMDELNRWLDKRAFIEKQNEIIDYLNQESDNDIDFQDEMMDSYPIKADEPIKEESDYEEGLAIGYKQGYRRAETEERKEMIRGLLKQLEYYYSDNEKHTRCPMCGLDFSMFDKELDRIEQEAERRGAISLYKELDDLDIMLAMLHSVEDTNDEEVHKIVGNIRNELKKTLDKLKLLEEENGKQNARWF